MDKVAERYERLAFYMSKASGLDFISNINNRKRPFPTLRAMVFARLRDEGATLMQMKEVSGITHSTIHHGISVLEGMLEMPTERDESDIETYHRFLDMAGEKVTISFTQSEWTAIRSAIRKIQSIQPKIK